MLIFRHYTVPAMLRKAAFGSDVVAKMKREKTGWAVEREVLSLGRIGAGESGWCFTAPRG
jgi:hypothetical protein